MALVTPIRPMADGTLIEFFMNEQTLLTGKRLRRVEAAHAELLRCIDVHARALVPQVDGRPPEGSVSRILPPRAILDVLPVFLDEQRWHGSDPIDRRIRSELVWRLAQHVLRRQGLEGSESYDRVREAVRRSRAGVRREKAEAGMRELDARRARLGLPPFVLPPRREHAIESVPSRS